MVTLQRGAEKKQGAGLWNRTATAATFGKEALRHCKNVAATLLSASIVVIAGCLNDWTLLFLPAPALAL